MNLPNKYYTDNTSYARKYFQNITGKHLNYTDEQYIGVENGIVVMVKTDTYADKVFHTKISMTDFTNLTNKHKFPKHWATELNTVVTKYLLDNFTINITGVSTKYIAFDGKRKDYSGFTASSTLSAIDNNPTYLSPARFIEIISEIEVLDNYVDVDATYTLDKSLTSEPEKLVDMKIDVKSIFRIAYSSIDNYKLMQEMYPDIVKPGINMLNGIDNTSDFNTVKMRSYNLPTLSICTKGVLKYIAFMLDKRYKWVMTQDADDNVYLKPEMMEDVDYSQKVTRCL